MVEVGVAVGDVATDRVKVPEVGLYVQVMVFWLLVGPSWSCSDRSAEAADEGASSPVGELIGLAVFGIVDSMSFCIRVITERMLDDAFSPAIELPCTANMVETATPKAPMMTIISAPAMVISTRVNPCSFRSRARWSR